MRTFLALASLLLLLQGCVPTKPSGPRFGQAPNPPASDTLATVYVYYLGGANKTVSFLVNGKTIFSGAPLTYSWIQLAPGPHTFKAEVGFWGSDLAASGKGSTFNDPAQQKLTLEAGKTYYLEYSTEGEISNEASHFVLGVGVVGPEYTEFSNKLAPVTEEQGRWNMRPMYYVPGASR